MNEWDLATGDIGRRHVVDVIATVGTAPVAAVKGPSTAGSAGNDRVDQRGETTVIPMCRMAYAVSQAPNGTIQACIFRRQVAALVSKPFAVHSSQA